MKTAFALMAQYDGLVVIPVERVCADYFAHLTPEKFLRKALAGEIKLPVVKIENSKRAARGVPLNDLAVYLDQQIAVARKDCEKLAEAS